MHDQFQCTSDKPQNKCGIIVIFSENNASTELRKGKKNMLHITDSGSIVKPLPKAQKKLVGHSLHISRELPL